MHLAGSIKLACMPKEDFSIKCKVILIFITIYLMQSCSYAQGIGIDKIGYIYGDKNPIQSGNEEYQISFLQNDSDEINISKIYFWVEKESNIQCGHVSCNLRANGDFLYMHKINFYVDGRPHNRSLTNGDLLLGPFEVRSNTTKIELLVQKNYRHNTQFPSISLTNITLTGLNFIFEDDIYSNETTFLSADEDRETIRQFISNAGPVVTISEGRNLSFIISLAEGKKIRLLEGIYQGPIDMIKKDHISIEGFPEATITGIQDNAILTWHDSSNVNLSNIFFMNSLGGIFLEDCSYFNISNVRINDFGIQSALSLKNTNKSMLSDLCIYSNEESTTGILMDNSADNRLLNNNIQVRNALYYFYNNSIDNIIYDRNNGKISDNNEIIDENSGTYCINGSCSETKKSNANNTWMRGDINPCS